MEKKKKKKEGRKVNERMCTWVCVGLFTCVFVSVCSMCVWLFVCLFVYMYVFMCSMCVCVSLLFLFDWPCLFLSFFLSFFLSLICYVKLLSSRGSRHFPTDGSLFHVFLASFSSPFSTLVAGERLPRPHHFHFHDVVRRRLLLACLHATQKKT